jgi:hemoglobin-like flavoprotein
VFFYDLRARSACPDAPDERAEAALVLASLRRISGRSEELFAAVYERLFESHPELQRLFPSDMREQNAKLAAALRLVIEQLRSPEHIVTALEDLGRRHVAYGVAAQHLLLLGDALLATLESFEGPSWNDPTRDAWQHAYGAIALAMQRGLESGAITRPGVRAGEPPARSA